MQHVQRFSGILGAGAIVTLLIAGFSSFSVKARAQAGSSSQEQSSGQAEDIDLLRQRALKLYDENNFVDALPLFEKVAAAKPDDTVIQERLGFCLMAESAGMRDDAQRRQVRVRARSTLLHAKELGDNSDLLRVILESLPSDGSSTPFSARKDVDDAMRQGEDAFVKGDFQKALASYRLALVLDPNEYEAALFTGDVYFKQKLMDKAGDWFAMAIQIGPQRETAYRYWGDALLGEGKTDEARSRYIDAVMAEPYTQRSWGGLHNWSATTHVELSHPRIDIPASVGTGKKPGDVNITMDPDSLKNQDTSAIWLAYSMERALWRGEKFAKEYPSEKTYRHSLKEEGDAMHAAAEVAREGSNKQFKNAVKDPSVANLLKLDDQGLLEPYILFARADQGIAQDYDEYRKAHQDKLRQYLEEYVAQLPK
jgi:tetratricopeptide (TPR) repeat protein